MSHSRIFSCGFQLYVWLWTFYMQCIYKPTKRIYDKVLDNSITQIVVYDLNEIKKETVFQITWSTFLMWCVCYWMGWKYRLLQSLWDFQDKSPRKLAEITCWDGKKYLLKYGNGFDIKKRPLQVQKKSKYIYAGIHNTADFTDITNKYVTTITEELHMTPMDFLVLMYLEGKITKTKLLRILTAPEPFVFALINNDTFDETVFKATETLVL